MINVPDAILDRVHHGYSLLIRCAGVNGEFVGEDRNEIRNTVHAGVILQYTHELLKAGTFDPSRIGDVGEDGYCQGLLLLANVDDLSASCGSCSLTGVGTGELDVWRRHREEEKEREREFDRG